MRSLFPYLFWVKFILLGLSLPSVVFGQVRVILTQVPANTPLNDTLYITGSFNDWDPGDDQYILSKNSKGQYEITMPPELRIFEYKFTRGSWQTVESDDQGKLVPNRVFNLDDALTLRTTIEGWEDMFSDAMAFTRFVITDIPTNTPYGADIYLTGNFNHWNPQDPTLKLQRGEDGLYRIDLPSSIDSFEYKFTRGSWQTVEGKRNGKFKENRFFARASNKSETVNITIESWEDIAGTMPRLTVLLLLFSGFAGIFVTFAVYNMPGAKRKPRNYLTILLAMQAVVTVVWVIFSEFKDPYQLYPKMFLVPDFIYFLFPPLFYGYVLMMTGNRVKLHRWHWAFLLPPLLQLAVYMPVLFIEHATFTTRLINNEHVKLFGWTSALGLLYGAAFFYLSLKAFAEWYRLEKNEQKTQTMEQLLPITGRFNYLRALMINYALVLFSWLVTGIGYLLYHYFAEDVDLLVDYGTETAWGCFALFPFVTAFYHITRPELFSVKTLKAGTMSSQQIPDEEMAKHKASLQQLMEKDKIYLNPKLTLGDLAKRMGMSIHQLSKIINQGYGKNFYDFINGYRIREFRQSSGRLKDGSENILSLAYKVGFNSKTAFNRAFKKMTGQTPSEIVKELKEEES